MTGISCSECMKFDLFIQFNLLFHSTLQHFIHKLSNGHLRLSANISYAKISYGSLINIFFFDLFITESICCMHIHIIQMKQIITSNMSKSHQQIIVYLSLSGRKKKSLACRGSPLKNLENFNWILIAFTTLLNVMYFHHYC